MGELMPFLVALVMLAFAAVLASVAAYIAMCAVLMSYELETDRPWKCGEDEEIAPQEEKR